jgi:hypothetical protein
MVGLGGVAAIGSQNKGPTTRQLAELDPTFWEPPLTIRLKLSHMSITRCKRWRGVDA